MEAYRLKMKVEIYILYNTGGYMEIGLRSLGICSI